LSGVRDFQLVARRGQASELDLETLG
jgi:hypothetical protein